MSEAPARVLMVSASFHPYLGGAEKQALELSAALRARGADVRVLTRRLPGLSPSDETRGVPIERLWRAGKGAVDSATFMLSLFWRLVRRRDYDAVHVHLAGSPALAAALAGKLARRPVLVKLGGGAGIGELAVSSRSVLGRLKLRALALLKPRLVAVTPELVSEAARYLGPAMPVQQLPNGVDTQRYSPASPEDKALRRERLGLPKGLMFLYAGRLSPEKRLPDFVEAWAAEARNVKACLVIVGDGIERERVVESARRSRVEGKVFLLPARPDVEFVYSAADVFVLPSISEGLSNALLEAMASGLAVLASRVGGAVDAVKEAESGFLFAPTDERELRRQLAKFLEHPELAASMGKAAREAALARFSLDKIAERYELIYRWGRA